MSIRRLSSRDIALTIVRTDRRCGRSYLDTLKRIEKYADCHHMTAPILYRLAERILDAERQDAA